MPRREGRAVPEAARRPQAPRIAHLAWAVGLALTVWLTLPVRALGAEAASAAEAGAVAELAFGELGHGFEAGQRAFLELEVNGVRRGEALVFVRGADYWVDLEALKAAGIQDRGDGDRLMIEGRMVVRIGSLAPRISAELDESDLILRLTADPSLLGRTVLDFTPARPLNIQYRRDTSAFVNYGATWHSGHDNLLSLETGVTAGPGLFTGYLSGTPDRFVRGPLSYTVDSRGRLQRWVVGDTVASSGALGSSAQLAGVSLSSNFALDPYFVRFPTVGLSGTVTAPSTVDIYVNDRLVRREQLQPGSFDINALPVPVGASSARVVIRDAFGHEQELSGSYYLSSGLLAPGLHQYQYAVGAERERSAYEQWAYGDWNAYALHRLGVTNTLTLGGRFEASPNVVNGGPQAVVRLGRFGEVEAAGAWSRHSLASGYAWSTGYLYTNRTVTFAGSIRGIDSDYATTSTRLDDDERLALETGLTGSTRLGRRASVSVSYQGRRFHGARLPQDIVSISTRIRTAARSSMYVTMSRSQTGDEVSPSVFAGMSIGLTRRDRVGATADFRDDRSRGAIEAQRSMPIGTGYGYRVRADLGDNQSLDLDGRYQTQFGRYELRHSDLGGQNHTSVTAAGGFVLIGGQVFATSPVQESFALVRVPEAASVRTYLSNQEIGRTDRHGNLLIPNLLPYYGNRVRIADEDVPLDRTIESRELMLAPPFRGGAIATFRVIREVRVAGTIIIQRGLGTIVPSFARVVAQGQDGAAIESFLGPAGEFYLEGLSLGPNTVRVHYSDMDCVFTLEVAHSDDPVMTAGTVTCVLP